MEQELLFSEFSHQLENYPGKYLLELEQMHLNTVLPQLYGYFLVQMGISEKYDLTAASSSMQRIYVGREATQYSHLCAVESNYDELPFQYESIDAFLLPHTLEFTRAPVKLLNEIYNILLPGGKVIILGYNPCSFLGLTHLFKLSNTKATLGKLRCLGRVKSWLSKNGFSISCQNYFSFRPPLKNKNLLKKLTVLEKIGQYGYPFFGNSYIVVAEKKVVPLSPVKAKTFTKKIPVTAGFPEPSTNKGL